MDLSEKDTFGMEKKSEDHLNYQGAGLSAEWQFGNPSIGMAPADPSAADCQRNKMSSMVEPFCPTLWNHPTNAQSLGFCEASVQTSGTSSSSIPIGKPVPMSSRVDMGGAFLQAAPRVLPPSLSHFPTDSAFIERAARFSCFNGGNFSGMVSPFGASESLSPYSNASKGSPKDSSMATHGASSSDSLMKGQRDQGSLHNTGGVSNNESGEPDFSGIGREEAPNLGSLSGDSSSRGLGAKKRKKTSQDMELEQVGGAQQLPSEAPKDNAGGKKKAGQNSSTIATTKQSGKQTKDSSEAPKEDYIHVRARRGQATNSHSLAERVRREKISERMKFLQDLVPGCSKVTGKAVMLDEIINYVQSLQRQVEFLSMKLATVNPRLDFNIEGLLSKDFLQPRDGSSSTMGFSHDMIHPQSHLPQQGMIPSGMSAITYPSDALRRALNTQLTMMNGYKESTLQMPSGWDDELNNVIQMNFGSTNPPVNAQELNGTSRDEFSI